MPGSQCLRRDSIISWHHLELELLAPAPHMRPMNLTRRKLLGIAGISVAAAFVPANIALAAGSGAGASASQSGLYAVVSKHATWGIFESVGDAGLEAETLRHSGAMQVNAVRCSPEMARQYQIGKIGNFVEVDGWALTPKEIKSKGLELLRKVDDRDRAKHQLLEFHLKQARNWLDAYDSNRNDAFWYTKARDKITGVLDNIEDYDGNLVLHRCSHDLYESIGSHLKYNTPTPAISSHTDFHMLESEHLKRLGEDAIYRIAIDPHLAKMDHLRLVGPLQRRFVVIAKHHRWILGAGANRAQALEMAELPMKYIEDEFVVVKASQSPAHAVIQNGYEIPGLWETSPGMVVHEADLGLLIHS